MKRELQIVIILILSLVGPILPQGLCLGATYYLDVVSGDDGNLGTDIAPWKTMSKARSEVSVGDTVILNTGNYGVVQFGDSDSYGTDWSQPITYKSAAGADAIFEELYLAHAGDNYLVFDGLHFQGPDRAHSRVAQIYHGVRHVKIVNCEAEDRVGYLDMNTNCVIQATAGTGGTPQDITVDNCHIHTGRKAVGGVAEQFYITNNHIHRISDSGIKVSGHGPILIEGNHVHNQDPSLRPSDPHGTGISIRSINTTVRGNIVHDYGNSFGIATYGDGDWPSETGYTNMLIENNLVYDTLQSNMGWFNQVGNNFVFRNNTFIGYRQAGNDYGYRYSGAVSIRFHSTNDGSGLTFYNNVIVANLTFDNPSAYLDKINEGKNIIWSLTDWGTYVFYTRFSPTSTSIIMAYGSSSSGTMLYGYKTYFEASGDFFVGGSDFEQYWTNYFRDPLDPHGVDLSEAYKLAQGSEAIGFANALNAPGTDLLGNQRDAAPDAGCYEYVPSGPNQAPVANAGPDQTITDKDKNGSEQVTLDGSGSFDPDSEIVSYVWNEGGLEIATGINPTVTLSTGTHLITLTVTDCGGLTDTDTVTIKVLEGDKEFGELPRGCYNNVFNPTKGEEALVVVELAKQSHVKISLYDIRGNKIRELADEEKEAGSHKYYWGGKDDSDNIVGSGLYFVHIQAGDYKKTKKIVVVK